LGITVLEEDFRMEQVAEALSGPGYLLPAEAKAQTQRNRTEFALSTATLSFAEFSPELEPTETELNEYYEANKQRYEIPERIQASYIFFPAEKYADQVVEATEAELREHFASSRAEFVAEYREANPTPEPAEGEEAPEEEPVTFDQVRMAVVASYREEQTSRAANEAAQTFAFQLYRDEISRDSAAFNQLLNESELSLKAIEPYTLAGASQRALSSEMLESAFALGGNRYYSDAYPVDGGFAVLIYEGRIAPEIPAYELVAGAVRADYAADQKRRLFNEKGVALKEELEAAVEEGKDFVEAAEALGLQAQSFENFEAQNAPAELNRSALQQAQGMTEGEVSPMLTLGGQGTFIYLAEKEVPELSAEDPDVTRTLSMLERWASFTTRSDLTSELVLRGLPEESVAEVE
jgi:peptidyl-prolyl cis-trans isomerase D